MLTKQLEIPGDDFRKTVIWNAICVKGKRIGMGVETRDKTYANIREETDQNGPIYTNDIN
jgi:hypothetical protein